MKYSSYLVALGALGLLIIGKAVLFSTVGQAPLLPGSFGYWHLGEQMAGLPCFGLRPRAITGIRNGHRAACK